MKIELIKFELIKGQLATLTLGPDDTLVVTCERDLRPESVSHLRDCVQREFPGRRVLVLQGGLKLGVVRAGEDLVERLREALLQLVYCDREGRWWTGVWGDSDVTDIVGEVLKDYA